MRRADGAVVSHYEVTSHPEIFDGVRLHKGQSIAVINHNARVILSCERVILNFLQRMSGIATLTRQFVDAVHGTKARILDTRKTIPGLRTIDKYAVRCGGGQNHRLDLSDGVLIKNNHIALAGGIVPGLDAHTAIGGDRSPSKLKCARWTRWNRRCCTAPKRFCSTTCRSRMCTGQWNIVLAWRSVFRWSVLAESSWRMFGLTRKRE